PKATPAEELSAGEVGFLSANIKTVSDAKIGDTITDAESPAAEPLPGFEEIKPMVFAGLYPVESHEHGLLRDALEKLRLNDSAFTFEPESSGALGFGFRCGLLGLLHLEIVQERLDRESYKIPRPQFHQAPRRADHRGYRHHARRLSGRHPGASGREARHAKEV